jgi:predicted deacylase
MNRMINQPANLVKKINWESHRIKAGSSTDTLLRIGKIGKNHPKALIVAGIHGDEQPWSGFAIKKMLSLTNESELIGSITTIPMANPYATEADSRVSHLDNLDLNRVFPGNVNGTHSERIASFIMKEVLNEVDIVIDLHGGGSWCVNSFAFKFKGSESLAEAFEAPFIVEGVDRLNTLTGYARDQGAQVTAIEMGGRCDEEVYWADKIARGLIRCLSKTGVLNKEEPVTGASTPVGKIQTLRPSRGGVFFPKLKSKNVGIVVGKGTILGYLCDSATFEILDTFKAPFKNTAILLLRPYITKIEQGAMTYVVAPLYK